MTVLLPSVGDVGPTQGGRAAAQVMLGRYVSEVRKLLVAAHDPQPRWLCRPDGSR